MEISKQEIEALKTLLKHKEPEYALQGIELWESFVDYDDIEKFIAQLMAISARRDKSLYQQQLLLSLKRLQLIFGNFFQKKMLSLWVFKTLLQFPEFQAQKNNIFVLNFEGFGLSEIEEEDWFFDIMSAFPHLRSLELRKNRYTKFPELCFAFPQLREIDLSENVLRELSDDMGRLQNLRALDLSVNRLDALDYKKRGEFFQQMEEIESLEYLGLRDNRIFKLPKEIKLLKQVRSLDLRNNYLSELPEEICELSGLEKLYLSHNRLLSLPKEIEKLESLNEIYLDWNRLSRLFNNVMKTFFRQLSRLPNLKRLNLNCNSMNSVPKNIKTLQGLEYLSLEGNDFTPRQQTRIRALLPNCKVAF